MRRIKSEQKMMKAPIAYAIGVSLFAIPLGLLLHSDTFDWNDPWSNKEALISLLLLFISATIMILVLNMRLIVQLDSSGIQYQMKPLNFSLKKIPISNIESIKIIAYNFSFSKGLGYHTNLAGHHFYALKWGSALEIKTKDSKLYNLGIQKTSAWQLSIEAMNKEINNGS